MLRVECDLDGPLRCSGLVVVRSPLIVCTMSLATILNKSVLLTSYTKRRLAQSKSLSIATAERIETVHLNNAAMGAWKVAFEFSRSRYPREALQFPLW